MVFVLVSAYAVRFRLDLALVKVFKVVVRKPVDSSGDSGSLNDSVLVYLVKLVYKFLHSSLKVVGRHVDFYAFCLAADFVIPITFTAWLILLVVLVCSSCPTFAVSSLTLSRLIESAAAFNTALASSSLPSGNVLIAFKMLSKACSVKVFV